MRIMSPYTLKWFPGGDEINAVSVLIRENYYQNHHARLSHCMPWLLGMYDGRGALKAACGIQSAGQGPLFLEHYLDQPIEALLASRITTSVARESIVEVGNFTAADGASARVMFAAVCQLLYQYHFAWIAFTGTRKIRNTFHRLHLQPIHLAAARPEKLADAAREWGDYYQHDPQVMAGELPGGHATLSHSSLLLSLFTPLPAPPWADAGGEDYVSGHA